MNIKEIKKGFSLIEISVVLLIVAIFVAAISSGKLLLDKSNKMRIEQGVKKALQSQEYYEDLVFTADTSKVTEDCDTETPTFLQITDYLNSRGKDGGPFCCDTSEQGSLCCQGESCDCGTNNSGSCLCNHDSGLVGGDNPNHPDC